MLLIVFELGGTRYQALNGGVGLPLHRGGVAGDRPATPRPSSTGIWDRIVDDGGKPQMCGWIKDRYGLPWQVVPAGSASG